MTKQKPQPKRDYNCKECYRWCNLEFDKRVADEKAKTLKEVLNKVRNLLRVDKDYTPEDMFSDIEAELKKEEGK